MKKAIRAIEDALDLVADRIDDFMDNNSSYQESSGVSITNTGGHIVIKGKIKSLKINDQEIKLQ